MCGFFRSPTVLHAKGRGAPAGDPYGRARSESTVNPRGVKAA